MSRAALVWLGYALALAAVALGVGLEVGAGWGLVAGGVLAGASLLFLADDGADARSR